MFSKNKIAFALIMALIVVCSISIVSAMNIEGGAISTSGGLEDLTYASVDVGKEYSGDNVIIQIYYYRNGELLNHGNMVPNTVTSNGFINVKSADAYKLFPDKAQINLYNTNHKLIATQDVSLSASSGLQTFGDGDYDHSYMS